LKSLFTPIFVSTFSFNYDRLAILLDVANIYNSYQMSENTDNANDYALAKLLNECEIKIFCLLADHGNLPDTTDVNRSYVLLAEELKKIYARQTELKKVGQPICWQVMSNLELFHENIGEYKTLAWEYVNSGADYGQEHNASVITLCIKSNASKPEVPPEINQLLSEAENNINAFQYELDKMHATLSFESYDTPVITIGNTSYRLRSMRYGKTFDIVSYCLEKFPDKFVGLPAIKKYLQLEKLEDKDITNLRDKLRGSLFEQGGPLQPFIEVSPHKIMIKRTTTLTDEQISSIKSVSKKIRVNS
jgi:hypothetical protein